MSTVDQRFALVDRATGQELFPYLKLQRSTNRYGFALSKPGERDSKGDGHYTDEIREVIQRVVIDGWKVRVKTINGKMREGSLGINMRTKADYWVAPEFLELIKSSLTPPIAALPSVKIAVGVDFPTTLQPTKAPQSDALRKSAQSVSTAVSPKLFTDDENNAANSEADYLATALNGFEGADQDVLAKRRVNQGKFRRILLRYWGAQCPVSDVKDSRLLIASHIVPWSKATKSEQGDPANGLLLSTTWDALFDRGMISFRDDGSAILDKIDQGLMTSLGIDATKSSISPTKLTPRHLKYFQRHRLLFEFE